MNYIKQNKIFLAVIALGIFGLFSGQLNFGAFQADDSYSKKTAQTATVITVSTATTTLLSANYGRDYGRLCIAPSSSQSSVLYLDLDSEDASSTNGMYLASSTELCWTANRDNPYKGPAVGSCSQTCWVSAYDY